MDKRIAAISLILAAALILGAGVSDAQRTEKPILHGKHWVAITGKPMAATAGAQMFMKGGNAVDAACAMLGAVCTMWDVLSWGGETQALIYNPENEKVIAVNALGVAPTGATPEFYKSKGYEYPPATGLLSAVTPGTPGGLITMLAEFGTMSLKESSRRRCRWPRAIRWKRTRRTGSKKTKTASRRGRTPRRSCFRISAKNTKLRIPGEVFQQPDLLDDAEEACRSRRASSSPGKEPERGSLCGL